MRLTLCRSALLTALLLVGESSLAETAGENPAPSPAQTQNAESAPAGMTRLFGEYVPLPDPETSGYNFYALAWHDAFANTTGGKHRGGGIVGNMYLSLTIDTETANWWNDGKLVLESIGVYGRRPSKVVGDYQFSSCIDAPDTIEPYQLFYQHSFFDDRLSILAGVQDFTLEFAVLDYGWGFLNSSFWTPATMTQQWWSFYPTTGLGSRAKINFSKEAYLLAGVYDGRPTDPARVRAIDWGLSKADGAYSIAEVGVSKAEEGQRPYKLAVGGWYSSAQYIGANGSEMKSNSGGYLIGQTMLLSEDETFNRGLGGFFQVGQADSSRNFNSWYYGAGLRYKGLIQTRDEDVLGLAWAQANLSSTYRDANSGFDAYEGALELTYRAKIRPYITLQPSVQYIANPGPNSQYDDAVILYLRSEIML